MSARFDFSDAPDAPRFDFSDALGSPSDQSGRQPAKPKFTDWRDLKKFAEDNGFTVTSTYGGQHNPGSAHYTGHAIDVRTRDKHPDEVESFMQRARGAGLNVLDERTRPAGQKVWGGPNVHIQIGAPGIKSRSAETPTHRFNFDDIPPPDTQPSVGPSLPEPPESLSPAGSPATTSATPTVIHERDVPTTDTLPPTSPSPFGAWTAQGRRREAVKEQLARHGIHSVTFDEQGNARDARGQLRYDAQRNQLIVPTVRRPAPPAQPQASIDPSQLTGQTRTRDDSNIPNSNYDLTDEQGRLRLRGRAPQALSRQPANQRIAAQPPSDLQRNIEAQVRSPLTPGTLDATAEAAQQNPQFQPPPTFQRIKEAAEATGMLGPVATAHHLFHMVGDALGTPRAQTEATFQHDLDKANEIVSTVTRYATPLGLLAQARDRYNQLAGVHEGTTPEQRSQDTAEVTANLQQQGREGQTRAAIERGMLPFAASFGHIAEEIARLVPGQKAADIADYLKRRQAVLSAETTSAPLDEQGQPKPLGLPAEIGQEVTTQGLNLARFMILRQATGASPTTIMVTEAALQNADKQPSELGQALGEAYLYGQGFEHIKHLNPAATAALFGTVGAGQTYAETGDPRKALVSGVGQGALFGGMGAFERYAPQLAEKVIEAQQTPEGLRGAVARMRGYQPVIVFNEDRSRAASVVVDKQGGQVVNEIPIEEAQRFVGRRPVVIADNDEFERAVGGAEVQTEVQPLNRQLPAAGEAGQQAAETTEPAPSAPPVTPVVDEAAKQSALSDLRQAPDEQSFNQAVERARAVGATPDEIDAAVRPQPGQTVTHPNPEIHGDTVVGTSLDGQTTFAAGSDGRVHRLKTQSVQTQDTHGTQDATAQPPATTAPVSEPAPAAPVSGNGATGQSVSPQTQQVRTQRGLVIQPPPVAEGTETIRAQFNSAIDAESPRIAVLVTPGERAPVRLTGFAQLQLPEGRLFVNRSKAKQYGLTKPSEIKAFISQHGFEPLIGKVEPVADTSQGLTLRTEDANGNELSSSVVTTPETAQAQAETDKAQFPQAAKQELIPTQAAAQRRAQESAAEAGAGVTVANTLAPTQGAAAENTSAAKTASPQIINKEYFKRFETGKGIALDKAAVALTDQLRERIARGDQVTLVIDNGRKRVPIVAINRGMMQDEKGQPWDVMGMANGADHVEVQQTEQTPAIKEQGGEKISSPSQAEQPTKAETRASVKKEKVDPRTGLTPTQTDYLAGELEDYANRHLIETGNYPQVESKQAGAELLTGTLGDYPTRFGETETIEVPGDGQFTINTVAGANKLHQKIMGEPIDGLPKAAGASVPRGSKPTRQPSTGSKVSAIDLYGHPVEALEALRPQRQQIEQDLKDAKDEPERNRLQRQLDALDQEIDHLESVQNQPGHLSEQEPLTPLGRARRPAQVAREKELTKRLKAATADAEAADEQHLARGRYWPSAEEVGGAATRMDALSDNKRREAHEAARKQIDRARERVREAIVRRALAATPAQVEAADVDREVEQVRSAGARMIATSAQMRKWFAAGERPDVATLEAKTQTGDWKAQDRAYRNLQTAQTYLSLMPKGEAAEETAPTGEAEAGALKMAREDITRPSNRANIQPMSADKPGLQQGAGEGHEQASDRPALTPEVDGLELSPSEETRRRQAWREQEAKVRQIMAETGLTPSQAEDLVRRAPHKSATQILADRRASKPFGFDPQYVEILPRQPFKNFAIGKLKVMESYEVTRHYTDGSWRSIGRSFDSPAEAENYLRTQEDVPAPAVKREPIRTLADTEAVGLVRNELARGAITLGDLRNRLASLNDEIAVGQIAAETQSVDLGLLGQRIRLRDAIRQVLSEHELPEQPTEPVSSIEPSAPTSQGAQPSTLKMARAKSDTLRKVENAAELAPQVEVTRSDNLVTVNEAGQEILRRAMAADVQSAQRAANFDGVFLDPAQVRETVKALQGAADDMKEVGWYDYEAQPLRDLAQQMIAASRAGKGTAVIKFESAPAQAEPHEFFHAGSYQGAGGKVLTERHAPESMKTLAAHPAVKAWRAHYATTPEYTSASDAVAVEETAATIAGGDYAKLGLTKAVAGDYLTKWFDSFVEQHGVEALNDENFRRQRNEVQQEIEAARQRFSDRAAPSSERPALGSGESVSGESPQTAAGATGGNGDPDRVQSQSEQDVATRLRSLPTTLRAKGVEAADQLYEIYGHQASYQDGKRLFDELGPEGAEALLLSGQSLGAEHMALADILSRALLSTASDVSTENPELARELRAREQRVTDALSAAATRAGQFIEAAKVNATSAEDVVRAAQKLVEARGRELSKAEEQAVRQAGEQLERATAELEGAAVQAAEKSRRAKQTDEMIQRAEEGRLTKRQIESLRTRLAKMKERERRLEQRTKELQEGLPARQRKASQPRQRVREQAIATLSANEDELMARVRASLGLGQAALKMAREDITRPTESDNIQSMSADKPGLQQGAGEGHEQASDRPLDFSHAEELKSRERGEKPNAYFRIQDDRYPLPERSRNYWAQGEGDYLEGVSGYDHLLDASRDLLAGDDVDGLGINYAESVREEGGQPVLSVFAGTDLGDEGGNVRGYSVEPERKTEIRFTPDEVLAAWKQAVLKEFPDDAQSVADMDFDDLADAYQLEDFDVDAFHALRDIAQAKLNPKSSAPTSTGAQSPALKMAQAQSQPTALDADTFESLAQLGALRILRQPKSDSPVEDWKESMRADFGAGLEPELDALHARAVEIKRAELQRARKERELDRIAQRPESEGLSRDEIEQIAEQEREQKRLARIATQEHERVARKFKGGQVRLVGGLRVSSKALAEAIGRHAANEVEAAAAAKLSIPVKPVDFYAQMAAEHGLTPAAGRLAMKAGKRVLDAAQSDLRASKEAAQALREATKHGLTDLDDARQRLSEARAAKTDAERKVARELRRLGEGKLEPTFRAATSLARDSLLTAKGVLRIAAGMGAKQAADLSARLGEGAVDAVVSKALGLPRVSGGTTLANTLQVIANAPRLSAQNIKGALTARSTPLMPAHEPPTENPYVNISTGIMQRIYGAKEGALRPFPYLAQLYSQARVFAVNDLHDGLVDRAELSDRAQAYLDGRADFSDSPSNRRIAISLAKQQAEYEVKGHKLSKGGAPARARYLAKHPHELLEAMARQEMERGLYANPNALADKLHGQRGGGAGNKAVELAQSFVIPFVKRPANSIADALMTYTGARIPIEAARVINSRFKEGDYDASARQAFNRVVARGSVGWGLFALGIALASMGLMTPIDDRKPGRKNVEREAGYQEGALHVNGRYYQISSIPFAGWLLGMGATYHAYGARAVPFALVRMISEHPLLRGIKEVSDELQSLQQGVALHGKEGAIEQQIPHTAAAVGARFIPSPVAMLAEGMDTKEREQRSTLAPILYRLPGARQTLPALQTVFGSEVDKPRISVIDPTTSSADRNSPVTKELLRLNVGVGLPRQRPSDAETGERAETAQQYRDRVRETGLTLKAVLEGGISSAAYQRLSDAERVKVLHGLLRFGAKQAEQDELHGTKELQQAGADEVENLADRLEDKLEEKRERVRERANRATKPRFDFSDVVRPGASPVNQ